MDVVTCIAHVEESPGLLLELVGQDTSLRKLQVTLLKFILYQALMGSHSLFVLTSLKYLGDVRERD